MYAGTVLLLLSSTSSLISAAAGPEPVKVARGVTPRQTSDNFLSAFFRIANQFDVSACIPGAFPLITTLPKIPSALFGTPVINQALSQTTLALSDVCSFSITGEVGDTYTSFLPSWYSWYHAQSSAIAKIITACPSASTLISTVEAYESCAQVPKTVSGSDTTEGSGSSETGSASATEASSAISIQTDTIVGGDDTTSALSIQTDTVIGGDDTTSLGPSSAPTESATATGTPEAPSTTVPDDSAPRETGFMLSAAAAAGFVGIIAAL
ncbi:hypothetical protein F5X99DRAFT_370926 [Biscogniauxia marginata]|nr:hypothetical protein F5X99DRAFT_370926 [Biscogniauxia marginata]